MKGYLTCYRQVYNRVPSCYNHCHFTLDWLFVYHSANLLTIPPLHLSLFLPFFFSLYLFMWAGDRRIRANVFEYGARVNVVRRLLNGRPVERKCQPGPCQPNPQPLPPLPPPSPSPPPETPWSPLGGWKGALVLRKVNRQSGSEAVRWRAGGCLTVSMPEGTGRRWVARRGAERHKHGGGRITRHTEVWSGGI